jgi:hypothetical protein
VAVQSGWGNLYDTPAAVRSLAVDVDRQAQVIAEVATPADGPVADRLPGQSLRLRALDPAGDGMHVVITAAAPGEVFGLARAQAGRPPNVVKQAARTIRLLVDATAAATGPLPGQDIPSVTR